MAKNILTDNKTSARIKNGYLYLGKRFATTGDNPATMTQIRSFRLTHNACMLYPPLCSMPNPEIKSDSPDIPKLILAIFDLLGWVKTILKEATKTIRDTK